MFGIHELILCVFEDYFSVLLCIHIGCMEMFGLHELILCEFEDVLSVLLCIHIGCIETTPNVTPPSKFVVVSQLH